MIHPKSYGIWLFCSHFLIELPFRTSRFCRMNCNFFFFLFSFFTEAVAKKRFDSIQSMIESKCAMSYLFDIAVSNQVNCATREADLKDLQVPVQFVFEGYNFVGLQLL